MSSNRNYGSLAHVIDDDEKNSLRLYISVYANHVLNLRVKAADMIGTTVYRGFKKTATQTDAANKSNMGVIKAKMPLLGLSRSLSLQQQQPQTADMLIGKGRYLLLSA